MVFGFVILNFMTSKEAIQAVHSVKQLTCSSDDIILIYVVDNNSPISVYNNLYSELSSIQNVTLVRNNMNVGFAKGNNIGIKAALKDNCDFVTCLNNDVEISSEFEFLSECKSLFKNNGIAIIGPKILDQNGKNQNPFLKEGPTEKEKEYRKKIYDSPLGRVRYWLNRYYIPKFKKPSASASTELNKPLDKPGEYYALHGSVLVFTPSFFNHYSGFDPATFLYGEELILAEMVKKVGLTCLYTDKICAYHAEDVSTDIFLQNRSKEKFCLKHEYNSIRHLVRKYY